MSELRFTAMVGFVVTTKPGAARKFYEEVLGFRFLTEDEYGMTFDARGALVRMVKAPSFTPAQGTVLGWEVAEIHQAVRALEERGVAFERYAWMQQDEGGVGTFSNGDKVAWFKDPEGNVLSLSQHVVLGAGAPASR